MPSIQRYELAPLLRGKLLTSEKAKEEIPYLAPFIRNYPIRHYREWQYGPYDGPLKRLLFADLVPAGKTEVLQFLLAVAEPPGKENEDPKNPSLLVVARGRNRWDGERGQWASNPIGPDEWKAEGEFFAVPFKEEFQAFVRGGDYFFVTKSGKLFHGPKPEKDKPRAIRCVWDDQRRPITAILTDADADRFFLFCGDKARGVFFEPAAKPEPKAFDLSKITASKLEGETGRLQTLARFLAREKLLKVPVK